MKIHELKTHPLPFGALQSGMKNFEIRKNDRDFRIGDELLLKEFIPKGYYEPEDPEEYTGKILHRRIDYILKTEEYGIQPGYVIMSISKV